MPHLVLAPSWGWWYFLLHSSLKEVQYLELRRGGSADKVIDIRVQRPEFRYVAPMQNARQGLPVIPSSWRPVSLAASVTSRFSERPRREAALLQCHSSEPCLHWGGMGLAAQYPFQRDTRAWTLSKGGYIFQTLLSPTSRNTDTLTLTQPHL